MADVTHKKNYKHKLIIKQLPKTFLFKNLKKDPGATSQCSVVQKEEGKRFIMKKVSDFSNSVTVALPFEIFLHRIHSTHNNMNFILNYTHTRYRYKRKDNRGLTRPFGRILITTGYGYYSKITFSQKKA